MLTTIAYATCESRQIYMRDCSRRAPCVTPREMVSRGRAREMRMAQHERRPCVRMTKMHLSSEDRQGGITRRQREGGEKTHQQGDM